MNQNTFQKSRLLEIYETDSRTFQQYKDYINQYFFLTAEANYYYWTSSFFKTCLKKLLWRCISIDFQRRLSNGLSTKMINILNSNQD